MSTIDNIQLWSDTALVRKASTNTVTASEKAVIDAQKEQKFNMYWNAPEGAKRIAFALSGPLKTRLDYVGVGRKLLMVDELPTGEVPYYDLDMPEFGAVKIAARGQAPTFEQAIKRISIPTFEVTVDEIVKKMELSVRKYPVFDRAKERAAIAMAIAEDDMIFDLVFEAALKSKQYEDPAATDIDTYAGTAITKADFADMYGKITEKQLIAKTYLLGVKTYADILKWTSTDLDPVSLNIQLETGNFGSIFGVRAIASTRLDKDYGFKADGQGKMQDQQPVFTVTSPDKLGRLPERKAVEVSIFDNIPKLQFDILAYEIIGMGIYNCGGVTGLKKDIQ